MNEDATLVGGIVIPSTDPVFIAMTVGVHIPLGIACVLAGAGAMLSEKRRGRHSTFGTVYFWCLLALSASATFLAVMRWSENYHLFILGALSFASAWIGRSAIRLRWRYWARLHNRAGPFLRLDADRLLCGQWKAASSLEGSAARNVLALAFPDRGTAAHSSAATPPRGACLTRALNFCPGLNFPIRPRRPKTP
jgi:hypothetical protein